MKIRLGYVALSKTLDDLTTSRTITYTQFENKGFPYETLYDLVSSDLEALRQILIYNVKNNIHFYRLTSKLVPLSTHNKVHYDYITPFKDTYKKIGTFIKENSMRIDTHPDQFAVLNSTDPRVVRNTGEILTYHYNILESLDIKDKIIILHVGGANFGKKKSMTRFINNFKKLPKHIQECIAIENDDKTFTVEDVLFLSSKLDIPVVFDYHHFLCNPSPGKLQDILKTVFKTWHEKTPKIHFSSPKSKLKKEFRAHHDYINSDTFLSFLDIAKTLNQDLDIMLEAKAKDEALFRLTREIKYKRNYIFLDETTFII